MSDGLRRVPVTRVRGTGSGPREDAVAVEEPLEVRLHGRSFAVIMRTPGADRELAAGFLFSEGVLERPQDLGAVEHCRHPDYPQHHNVVDVFLAGAARDRVHEHLDGRRNVLASSSCGLCGRVTIDSLRGRAAPLPTAWQMDVSAAAALPALLRARQGLFDETGGLHAAGLFAVDGGACVSVAEDVGRHNAVDKVIGRMLIDERLPLDGLALVVSGRASFEIVQKAWMAGVGFICAVSAPSSLAIALAADAGITLLGFARGDSFNVYSHPGRLRGV
jgi:FdhD protein